MVAFLPVASSGLIRSPWSWLPCWTERESSLAGLPQCIETPGPAAIVPRSPNQFSPRPPPRLPYSTEFGCVKCAYLCIMNKELDFLNDFTRSYVYLFTTLCSSQDTDFAISFKCFVHLLCCVTHLVIHPFKGKKKSDFAIFSFPARLCSVVCQLRHRLSSGMPFHDCLNSKTMSDEDSRWRTTATSKWFMFCQEQLQTKIQSSAGRNIYIYIFF